MACTVVQWQLPLWSHVYGSKICVKDTPADCMVIEIIIMHCPDSCGDNGISKKSSKSKAHDLETWQLPQQIMSKPCTDCMVSEDMPRIHVVNPGGALVRCRLSGAYNIGQRKLEVRSRPIHTVAYFMCAKASSRCSATLFHVPGVTCQQSNDVGTVSREMTSRPCGCLFPPRFQCSYS